MEIDQLSFCLVMEAVGQAGNFLSVWIPRSPRVALVPDIACDVGKIKAG